MTATEIGMKRKLEPDAEIEIDVHAPEPPSKKSLRKAKKLKPLVVSESPPDTEPNFLNVKRSKYGIWVGNLDFSITKRQLLDFISGDEEHPVKGDQVTRLHLPAGKIKHGSFQNKGFAYVDFADEMAHVNALQLSEQLLLGRRVLIKDARDFEGRPDPTGSEEKGTLAHPPSRRIFVGNLGFDVTGEALQSHFTQCGAVESVHVATFEDSGKCKGYAWITFEDVSAASVAMRGWTEVPVTDEGSRSRKSSKRRVWLNKMSGRKLRMEYAEDATTRYNKRFGKKSSANNPTEKMVEHADKGDRDADKSSNTAFGEFRRTSRPRMNRQHAPDLGKHDSPHVSKRHDIGAQYGYDREVVDRIKGNIIPSSGKKVRFD